MTEKVTFIDKAKTIASKRRTWAAVSAIGLAGAYFVDGNPVEAFRSLLTFFGV